MPSLAGKVPVVQDPRVYLLAIERHGQYMIWNRSTICYCLTEFNRPDPSCDHCFGRGRVYAPVQKVPRIVEAVGNGSFTVKLVRYNIDSITRVYSKAGTWSVSSFSGDTIRFTTPVPKATVLYIDFIDTLVQTFTGKAVAEDNGMLRVPMEIVDSKGVFVGQIVGVSLLYNNTKVKALTPIDAWENRILVADGDEDVGDDIDVSVTWIRPTKYLINQVWPTLIRNNPTIAEKFDAQVTFPGTFEMGMGDLLTPTMMRTRTSVVGTYKVGEVTHKLPFFHVADVLKVECAAGEITGWALVRKNEIKWGVQKPVGRFSVQLTYYPTFMVDDSVPSVRNAEDKTFPKRMMLKRFDLFNQNVDRPNARITA